MTSNSKSGTTLRTRAGEALDIQSDLEGLWQVLECNPDDLAPIWYGHCRVHQRSLEELEKGATRLQALIGILRGFEEQSASYGDPLRAAMSRLGEVVPGYVCMSAALEAYLVELRKKSCNLDEAVVIGRGVACCVVRVTRHKIRRDLRMLIEYRP